MTGTIDAVAFMPSDAELGEGLLLSVREGCPMWDWNPSLCIEDGCLPDPPGVGLWLWNDEGTTIGRAPGETLDELMTVGQWVRPDDAQALAIVAGRMPWDDLAERSPVAAERDEALDRVAALEARVLELECDLAARVQGAEEPTPAECYPLWCVREQTDDGPWQTIADDQADAEAMAVEREGQVLRCRKYRASEFVSGLDAEALVEAISDYIGGGADNLKMFVPEDGPYATVADEAGALADLRAWADRWVEVQAWVCEGEEP